MMHKILVAGEKLTVLHISIELGTVQLEMVSFSVCLKSPSGAMMAQEGKGAFFSSEHIFMLVMLYFIIYIISDSTTVYGCGFG